jgi:hypothetical protein
MSLAPNDIDIAYSNGFIDGLECIKKDVIGYLRHLLNEAEHAKDIGAKELQFASVTGAAVLDRVVDMIDARKKF